MYKPRTTPDCRNPKQNWITGVGCYRPHAPDVAYLTAVESNVVNKVLTMLYLSENDKAHYHMLLTDVWWMSKVWWRQQRPAMTGGNMRRTRPSNKLCICH